MKKLNRNISLIEFALSVTVKGQVDCQNNQHIFDRFLYKLDTPLVLFCPDGYMFVCDYIQCYFNINTYSLTVGFLNENCWADTAKIPNITLYSHPKSIKDDLAYSLGLTVEKVSVKTI